MKYFILSLWVALTAFSAFAEIDHEGSIAELSQYRNRSVEEKLQLLDMINLLGRNGYIPARWTRFYAREIFKYFNDASYQVKDAALKTLFDGLDLDHSGAARLKAEDVEALQKIKGKNAKAKGWVNAVLLAAPSFDGLNTKSEVRAEILQGTVRERSLGVEAATQLAKENPSEAIASMGFLRTFIGDANQEVRAAAVGALSDSSMPKMNDSQIRHFLGLVENSEKYNELEGALDILMARDKRNPEILKNILKRLDSAETHPRTRFILASRLPEFAAQLKTPEAYRDLIYAREFAGGNSAAKAYIDEAIAAIEGAGRIRVAHEHRIAADSVILNMLESANPNVRQAGMLLANLTETPNPSIQRKLRLLASEDDPLAREAVEAHRKLSAPKPEREAKKTAVSPIKGPPPSAILSALSTKEPVVTEAKPSENLDTTEASLVPTSTESTNPVADSRKVASLKHLFNQLRNPSLGMDTKRTIAGLLADPGVREAFLNDSDHGSYRRNLLGKALESDTAFRRLCEAGLAGLAGN